MPDKPKDRGQTDIDNIFPDVRMVFYKVNIALMKNSKFTELSMMVQDTGRQVLMTRHQWKDIDDRQSYRSINDNSRCGRVRLSLRDIYVNK